MALWAGKSHNLILLEANPANAIFCKNLKNRKKINIINKAYSLSSESLSFFIPKVKKTQYGGIENGCGSLYIETLKEDSFNKIEVDPINMQKLISLHKKNENMLIKVDVEGNEKDFIEELNILKNNYKKIIILIEINNYNTEIALQKFSETGFKQIFKGQDWIQTINYIYEI